MRPTEIYFQFDSLGRRLAWRKVHIRVGYIYTSGWKWERLYGSLADQLIADGLGHVVKRKD